MLEEKTSVHLGVPYVYLPEKKKFLCKNGVLFTLEEYKKGIDINAEYDKRKNTNDLYDYIYAKNTGILRKKRGLGNMELKRTENKEFTETKKEEPEALPETSSADRKEQNTVSEMGFYKHERLQNNSKGTAVIFIAFLLGITSVISGYISTLHTATYLYDYVDIISAWLMSASVTAYNATAFEVAVIFRSRKRYGLTFVFMVLWAMVTLFSMATTVSVFYDRFNFNEAQIALENKSTDSNKLALELLHTKEKDLRGAIEFKKKDIEYRQEREYATTAVRLELENLQKELQANLTEQQKLLEATPEVTEKVTKRKESLFSFLGRLMHLEGGILEFTMSTLSAIFVNLICPFSMVAVTELKKKKDLTEVK